MPEAAGYAYAITVTDLDGKPLPGAAVEIGPVLHLYSLMLIWLDRGRPRPLCIDGREYHRRQLARRRRRR
jgi:hypothetical protein